LDEFRPQIEHLGKLIERDLSAWTAVEPSSVT
jgi:hypothetical protein